MVMMKSEGIRLRGHRPRIFLLVSSSRLCGIDFLSETADMVLALEITEVLGEVGIKV